MMTSRGVSRIFQQRPPSTRVVVVNSRFPLLLPSSQFSPRLQFRSLHSRAFSSQTPGAPKASEKTTAPKQGGTQKQEGKKLQQQQQQEDSGPPTTAQAAAAAAARLPDPESIFEDDPIASFTRPWDRNPETSMCNRLKLAACGYHPDPNREQRHRMSNFEIQMAEEFGERRMFIPKLKTRALLKNIGFALGMTVFCLAVYRYVALQSSGGGADGLEQLSSVFKELKSAAYEENVKMLDELERLQSLHDLEQQESE